MVLNEEKTKTLLIAGKRLKKEVDILDIDLTLNGEKLEQVTSFNLLGVTYDNDLSFDVHVDNICKKHCNLNQKTPT